MQISDSDHVKGNKNAQVTLIEYGDFECPYCREAYPIVETIQELKKSDLRVIFRNFPLSEIHPNAKHAAYAAEAAAKQGKFWEMHHLLFKNQEALEDQDLLNYAKELNLNIQQFKKDKDSEEIAKKVENDFMSGVKNGVNGTPTFFINGIRFDKSYELDLLLEAIDRIENKKRRR